MLAWGIRLVLAAGVVVVVIAGLGSGGAQEAPPSPTLVRVEPTVEPTSPPVAVPTREPPEVARIISRITRETPAPYPTSTPLPAGVAIVNVVDFGYMPSVTRIHTGQTVVWQNGGRELHDITGEDDWHSGPIEPTTEYRHTFGFEGSFEYRCSVHPDMRGTIVVES